MSDDRIVGAIKRNADGCGASKRRRSGAASVLWRLLPLLILVVPAHQLTAKTGIVKQLPEKVSPDSGTLATVARQSAAPTDSPTGAHESQSAQPPKPQSEHDSTNLAGNHNSTDSEKIDWSKVAGAFIERFGIYVAGGVFLLIGIAVWKGGVSFSAPGVSLKTATKNGEDDKQTAAKANEHAPIVINNTNSGTTITQRPRATSIERLDAAAAGDQLIDSLTGAATREVDLHRRGTEGTESLFWRQAQQLHEFLHPRQSLRFESYEYTLEVTDALDIVIETERKVAAVEGPVFALCGARACNDQRCESFEHLDLKFWQRQPNGDAELEWIPTLDDPNEKRWVVLLREILLPGEPAVAIRASSVWPKAASRNLQRLNQPDQQEFTVPHVIKSPIEDPVIHVKVPSRKGRFRIRCNTPHTDQILPDERTGSLSTMIRPGRSNPGRRISFTITRLSLE